jgi:hypothetical protein
MTENCRFLGDVGWRSVERCWTTSFDHRRYDTRATILGRTLVEARYDAPVR